MQPRDILAATPFFAEVLDAAALDRLAAGVGLVQFDKGAAIIREDDAGDGPVPRRSGSLRRRWSGARWRPRSRAKPGYTRANYSGGGNSSASGRRHLSRSTR